MTPLSGAASALLLAATLSACGRGAAARNQTQSVDTASASIAAPTTLAFTVDQLAHAGVKWSLAEPSTVATSIEVPGHLVPNDDRTARLSAPAEARVVSVQVNPGDRIAAGQVLVKLQSREASSARADYAKAVAEVSARKASAKYARAARERAERLLDAKAIARQDVERAHADDELAQSMLAQGVAEVQRARSAMSALGVSESGAMVLRSPVAGVVLARDAVPGAVVAAGAPLVTVADSRTLWLAASVSDATASTLKLGARVRFAVPAYPNEMFEGRIQSVGAGLDSATRALPVRAMVENRAGKLRPAMFATVLIEGGAPRSGFTVPESAVQLLNQKPIVFVARPNANGGAAFERREVEIGATSNGRAHIVRGLSVNDLVVTDGAFAIKSAFSRSMMSEG